MHKVDLPIDSIESQSAERRRIREVQRKSRIFNARIRTIGVDVNALDKQCAERRWLEEQEKRRSDAFSADMLRNDMISSLLQKRQECDIRELNKSINLFRERYQARNEDALEEYVTPSSISSMQRFLGDDPLEKERRKMQQEQQREWTKQQINDKKQERINLDQANRLYDVRAIENDHRSVQLGVSERNCRRAINESVRDYNIALSQEKKSKQNLDRQKTLEENMTEISNQVFGDILTENPNVSRSSFGAHRVIADRWKGMTKKEMEKIQMERNYQVLEKQKFREGENQRNIEWNRQILNDSKALLLHERQQNVLKSELLKAQAEENKRLSMEQRARLERLNKEVYTNQPTDSFFMQFNTTSR